jgi:hypothetical protein
MSHGPSSLVLMYVAHLEASLVHIAIQTSMINPNLKMLNYAVLGILFSVLHTPYSASIGDCSVSSDGMARRINKYVCAWDVYGTVRTMCCRRCVTAAHPSSDNHLASGPKRQLHVNCCFDSPLPCQGVSPSSISVSLSVYQLFSIQEARLPD